MPFVIDYSPVAALGSLAVSAGQEQGKGQSYQRAFDHQRQMDALSLQINQQNRLADMDARLRLRDQSLEASRYRTQASLIRTPEQEAALAVQAAGASEAARQAVQEPYRAAGDQRDLERAMAYQEAQQGTSVAREQAKYEAMRQFAHETFGAEQGDQYLRQWMEKKAGASGSTGVKGGDLRQSVYDAVMQGDEASVEAFLNSDDLKYNPNRAQIVLEVESARKMAKAAMATQLAVPSNIRNAPGGGDMSQIPPEALYGAFKGR